MRLLYCSVVFWDVVCIRVISSWYKRGEELRDAPNSMLFAHTALVLNTPDSDESGVTDSKRIGARAKNDIGVPLVGDISSSSEAEIVAPIRKPVSPVR